MAEKKGPAAAATRDARATIKIRPALRSDKDKILGFCTRTFSWGDYIDQVWDLWYSNRKGRLFVAESAGGEDIAVSHAQLFPYKKGVWLEGIRVRPDRRRSGIASLLIDAMVDYGRKNGAALASAIVAAENSASQRLMEKSGFKQVSRWVYYSTGQQVQKIRSEARLATVDELEEVWQYLVANSEIFGLSAGRYVRAWRWYPLDRRALSDLVRRKRVVLVGRRPIDGVAIINTDGYWDRTDVLQVVYLDSASAGSLQHLISFAANLYALGGFRRLHVLCHQSESMTSAIRQFRIEESEKFILYNKEILFTKPGQ